MGGWVKIQTLKGGKDFNKLDGWALGEGCGTGMCWRGLNGSRKS